MKNLKAILKAISIATIIISSCYSLAAENKLSDKNAECQDFIKSIADTHNYGWLNVAETPENLNQVSIFYYFNKSASLKDPVVFFNGGPGSTSHSNMKTYENIKNKIDIDFIFMDQRGTGCSSAFPKGIDSQTIEKLKWYGSAGIVRDAEELRKYLIGDRKWKIFGQSFGGHVVHRYIEMFPESILKAYAHGFAIGQTDFDASYARIVAHTLVLESYYKVYPQDRQRLIVLNKYLSDKTICFSNGERKFCGFEILYPFVQKTGFKFHWAMLHSNLESLVPNSEVDKSKILEFVNLMSTNLPFYNAKTVLNDNYFLQLSVAINFIGIYDSNTTPMDYDKCLAIYKKMEIELNIKVGESLLDECKAPFQFNYSDQLKPIFLNKIHVSDSNYVQLDKVKLNLTKYNIAFYLYSGSLDSFVPRSLFPKEVEYLGSHVNYTNFLESGHEGYMTEPQVILNLAE